jgi:hypothetical protein
MGRHARRSLYNEQLNDASDVAKPATPSEDWASPAVPEHARTRRTQGFDYQSMCETTEPPSTLGTGSGFHQATGSREDKSPGADEGEGEGQVDGEGETGGQGHGHGAGEEGEVEVHGEYERDETDAPPMRRKSFLAGMDPSDNLAWLRLPPLTRGDALRGMNPIERMVFEFLIIMTPLLLVSKVWQFAQKSAAWLWARTGRLTGSHTGTAVGHQRGTPVLKGPYESQYFRFKGNVASRWGSGKEVYATQCYVNDFNRLVTSVFREQRQSGSIQRTMADGRHDGYFVFRNQRIPVADIDQEPNVEVRHYGLLIDPWNHHRGVSPDGVVFINDLAVGVLEVKCAYAQEKSLYVNIKPYYIDQIMTEMYIGHLYWPTIQWVAFCVWSPDHFTSDVFTFDAKYYYQWYGPRELKYYFRLYLKALAEKVYLTAQQESGEHNPCPDSIRRVIERDYTLPDIPVAPPTPPHTPLPTTVLYAEATDAPPGYVANSGQGSLGSSGSHCGTEAQMSTEWARQLLEMDLDFADQPLPAPPPPLKTEA